MYKMMKALSRYSDSVPNRIEITDNSENNENIENDNNRSDEDEGSNEDNIIQYIGEV